MPIDQICDAYHKIVKPALSNRTSNTVLAINFCGFLKKYYIGVKKKKNPF